MEKIILIVSAVLLMVAIAFGVSLILAIPTMLLWDWLMPQIFGLKEITFMQAWGINWLCAILFKNTNTSSRE